MRSQKPCNVSDTCGSAFGRMGRKREGKEGRDEGEGEEEIPVMQG